MENGQTRKIKHNCLKNQGSQLALTNTPLNCQKLKNSKKATQNIQNGLSNIVEVTEEYQHQKTIVSKKNCQNFDKGEKINEKQNKPKWLFSGLLKKTMNCLFFTYHRIYSQFTSQEVNVAQSQISEMLNKLRKKKDRRISLLPDIKRQLSGKRTLVLDLDETLVSLSYRKPRNYDFQIQITTKATTLEMYIVKRFGLDSFLFEMSQMYELVIFSSLKSDIVEQIVSLIDPKKYISYCLTRQHCVVINQTYFIKPVRDLGRDTKNVIAVDTYGISASLNPQNLYKIEKFRGSNKDRKLIKLGYFLKYVYQNTDIKEIIPVQLHRKQFQTKQIQICSKQNIQRYKEEKTSHRKKFSQVQSILSKPEQSSISVFPQKL